MDTGKNVDLNNSSVAVPNGANRKFLILVHAHYAGKNTIETLVLGILPLLLKNWAN